MPSKAYYEDQELHAAAHFAEDSGSDYNDFLEQQPEPEDPLVSSFCTYRCRACDAYLTIGPMDTARLRKIKYTHDRDECPSYDGAPLRPSDGVLLPHFDDHAWQEAQVKRQVQKGLDTGTVCLVGPAVPK